MAARSLRVRSKPADANNNLLVQAAEAGNSASVEALLTGGADVNGATETGTTALMLAAKYGHVQLVRTLLEKGADINQKRNDGFTALSFAVFFGQTDVVRLLLQKGADPESKSRFDTSLRMWANARGFQEITRILGDASSIEPRDIFEKAHTVNSVDRPKASFSEAQAVQTQLERPRVSGNNGEEDVESIESSEVTVEASPTGPCPADEVVAAEGDLTIASESAIAAPGPESVLAITRPYDSLSQRHDLSPLYSKPIGPSAFRYHRAIPAESSRLLAFLAKITSNWWRVTVTTLVVMSVCGLETILFLKMIDMRAMSQNISAPKSAGEHAATQMKEFSTLRVAASALSGEEASASPASKKRTASKSLVNTRAENEIENRAAIGKLEKVRKAPREIKVWHSNPEKTIQAELKQTPVSKKEATVFSVSTAMSSSSTTEGAIKTVIIQSPAGSPESESGAVPEGDTRPAPLSIETQRPRSVKPPRESQPTTRETNSPIISRGSRAKTKVVQWP